MARAVRDMVWAIPRGIPKTRAPFASRAEQVQPTDGEKTWLELCKAQEKRGASQFVTAPISGATLLSAQAINAENVPFVGRVEHNLLLHFWQVVVMTYVPQTVDNEGKRTAKGYVLAIPDVANLRDFLEAFPELLHGLEPHKRGRRPSQALIDVAAQSTLEFLRGLRDLGQSKAGCESWRYSVSAVESFHMLKLGNNIKLLAFDRVVNRPSLIRDYDRIERTYRNPLFRQMLLRALCATLPGTTG